MQITVKKGKIEEFPSDIIVVFQFEGTKRLQGIIERVNKASHDLIREIFKGPDFKGKLYQTLLLYTKGAVPAKRILITGLGKRTEFNLDKLRGVGAKVARSVRELGLKEFATSIPLEGLKGIILDEISQAFVEGVRLGLYKFDELKSKEKENAQEVKNMTLLEEIPERMKKIKEGAQRAEIIANVVHLTRDMVSRPGNLNTPTIMASIARSMAKAHDLKCKIMEIPEMKKLGMGALLGVAQGSNEPAKFIILEYQGNKRKGDHIVLVGKGITFDSGGISIKPAQDMDRMKSDMAGGAAVMGALQAVSQLKLPLNVVGLIPATENLPSGQAYKPGDVLKSLSGKTIEITNTDAEGRLILADALSYATKYKPTAIIDLATLTGACVIALGEDISGLMGNDERLLNLVTKAAEKSGEKVWKLPIGEEYQELIKGEVADLKNAAGRPAGTITAAVFLSKFVEDYPWVHLDIAGTAWKNKDKLYTPKGASGVGVRLLVQFLRDWAKKGS